MPQFLVQAADLRLDRAEALLRGDEAHHLVRVFRARAGDAVDLFDGEGRRWRAALEKVGTGEVLLTQLAPLPANEPRVEVCLLQGVLKGEKWAWVLSKGTELGARRFVPVLAERSVSVVEGDRAAAKSDRWQGIATAAAKQCERALVPRDDPPRPLAEVLETLGAPAPGEERLVFVERRTAAAPARRRAAERFYLAVGPEGGWSESEKENLVRAGFEPASLGSRILRAETAATAALALVLGAAGELGDLPGR
ncbi:MAG: 16S rRNA (uracil(1498)-N(3))-methyltransferase [Deltaproteobacteria bacterium]|nr:16S rRNA (uracil(1498)-N(3))-methyltransferase [Deltaproteobacteria bacterium]